MEEKKQMTCDNNRMLPVSKAQIDDVLADMHFYLKVPVNYKDKERYHYYLELLRLLGLITPAIYKELAPRFR